MFVYDLHWIRDHESRLAVTKLNYLNKLLQSKFVWQYYKSMTNWSEVNIEKYSYSLTQLNNSLLVVTYHLISGDHNRLST